MKEEGGVSKVYNNAAAVENYRLSNNPLVFKSAILLPHFLQPIHTKVVITNQHVLKYALLLAFREKSKKLKVRVSVTVTMA